MINKSLYSSAKEDWGTPREFFNELDKEFHFILDAAADEENSLCEYCITKEVCGLKHSWNCDVAGSVWVNPPYGRDVGKWVAKAHKEAFEHNLNVVMLLAARTDTKWFHEYIYKKPGVEIRFIKGRVKFIYNEIYHLHTHHTGLWEKTAVITDNPGAPFPSMVVIFRG